MGVAHEAGRPEPPPQGGIRQSGTRGQGRSRVRRSVFLLFCFAAAGAPCGAADGTEPEAASYGRVAKFEADLVERQIAESAEPQCTDETRKEFEWNHMKWVPPFASYKIQGVPIEELDPHLNFRRGYSLGYVGDPEDKTHLLPFFRAALDRSLARRPRRVLLDLGGKDFASSVLWFLRMYPLTFTEVHAFEGVKGRFKVPAKNDEEDACRNLTAASRLHSRAILKVPDQMLSNIHIHEKLVGIEDKDDGKRQWINITRFIKDELKLTANDTVVVKMDIDGGEWIVLPAWMNDREMPQIIDDLYVEVHYNHPTMNRFRWYTHPQSRADALGLLLMLRSKDFYVHAWP